MVMSVTNQAVALMRRRGSCRSGALFDKPASARLRMG